jgi:hypothetical protein
MSGTAGKKKPGDRQPKKERPGEGKVPLVLDIENGKQVTLEGITVTIHNEALDDFEFMDELHQLDTKRNGVQLPSILRRFVGADYAKVMEHLRDPETGRVPILRGSEFVYALIRAINPN